MKNSRIQAFEWKGLSPIKQEAKPLAKAAKNKFFFTKA